MKTMPYLWAGLIFCSCSLVTWLARAEDPVYSGPQVGEPLPQFTVRGVLGDKAGQELDFVAQAKDGPIVLIFVHQLNRPAISFTRTLATYTQKRTSDGLTSGIVWLDDDLTTGENNLKRIQHVLTPDLPLGVAPEGREGPGSYGLNRKVALTVLIAKNKKVTANFALVQPSLQSDLPKVVQAIIDVAGGQMPKLDELLPAQMQQPIRQQR